ncbi:Gldg family protein [Parasphingorhabdus cellanae]|uniref:Gldg family protein n=1 Tax=Parasphingorhabdus cellanae TaxID=2806553 RepID=A0ABX7T607_9SPHN|nr:Gldg family protein [Parasphingorhabdus cellanae]QTD55557.1 Gldg family protein [Parasphingorhabdus cellanae]
MTRIAVSGLLLLAAGLLTQCSPAATNASAENSAQHSAPVKIQLMTSLPIIWGEGASMQSILSGKTSPAPIYAHWQQNYDIAAVDSFEALEKSGTDIVLLAQPPAMAPADIAAVDAWVRTGGKAIILTDPMLLWPTHLPLGDQRRPLASGLLSPLLEHWGLELQAPDEAGSGGVELEFSGATISTAGIGTFKLSAQKSSDQSECVLSTANVMASCSVGKGRAIIFADADFLNDALWPDIEGGANKDGVGDAKGLIDILITDLRDGE